MTDYKYFNSKTFSSAMSDNMLELINELFPVLMRSEEPTTARAILNEMLLQLLDSYKPKNSKPEDLEKISILTNEINDEKQKHIDIIKIKDDKINNLLLDIENFKNAISELSSNESEILKEKNFKIDELLLEVENLNNALYEASEAEGILKKERNDKMREFIIEKEKLNQTIAQLTSKEPETIEVQIPVKLTDSQNIINLTPMEKYIMDTVCHKESKRTGKTISSEIILKDIFNRYIAYGPCDYFPRPFSDSELKELHTKFNPKPV